VQVFRRLLVNTLLANTANNFLWFALTFWAYLETKSVLATSIIGGSYMAIASIVGIFLGSIVDHNPKKKAMLGSTVVSLICYVLALLSYLAIPPHDRLDLATLPFWSLVFFTLVGAIAGGVRNIALSTLVTALVDESVRDRANGMVGTVQGVGFAITSVFSGLAIGFLGMGWCLGIVLFLSLVAILHLASIRFDEVKSEETSDEPKKVDLKGTLRVIGSVPGLMALILFATFNNFLGGVFMSLMDPYGLSLVSVEVWGFIWGFLSLAFIAGGIVVARRGLGKKPLRSLLLANVVMWVICILFPMRSSIVMLTAGIFVYMCLMPMCEAAEQTLLQTVVPHERQGRVFGFALTVETAASPITAFIIGPVAQYWVIPFMNGGAGSQTIGSWFGTGPERGMALIFVCAGIIGLIVTILAMQSGSYRSLSKHYESALNA